MHAPEALRSLEDLTTAVDLYPFDHRFREGIEQRSAGWLYPR
jgi:hypothetical protein